MNNLPIYKTLKFSLIKKHINQLFNDFRNTNCFYSIFDAKEKDFLWKNCTLFLKNKYKYLNSFDSFLQRINQFENFINFYEQNKKILDLVLPNQIYIDKQYFQIVINFSKTFYQFFLYDDLDLSLQSNFLRVFRKLIELNLLKQFFLYKKDMKKKARIHNLFLKEISFFETNLIIPAIENEEEKLNYLFFFIEYILEILNSAKSINSYKISKNQSSEILFLFLKYKLYLKQYQIEKNYM